MRAIGTYACFLATLVLSKMGYVNWWVWIIFGLFVILTITSASLRLGGR